MANAAADPVGSGLGQKNPPVLARKVHRGGFILAQAAHVIGANRGQLAPGSLGEKGLSAVRKLVGQATFDADVDLSKLVGRGMASNFDVVLGGALGSVPFIGTAAKLAVEAVMIAKAYHDFEEKRPPLFRMTPAADTRDTEDALGMLRSSDDWTGMWLPRTARHSGALPGDPNEWWPETLVDGGMQFALPPAAGGVDRFGCAPGDLFYVDAGIQARIVRGDVTLPAKKNPPSYRQVLNAGKNLEVAARLVSPLGSYRPSLSALGRAAWAMVGTSQNVAMFNVDAARVQDEWETWAGEMTRWREFFRSTYSVEFGLKLPTLGEKARRDHIAIFLSRVGAAWHDKLGVSDGESLRVQLLGRGGKDVGRSVGKSAVEHAAHLRKRQRAALKTTLNALVSRKAAAFSTDKELRELLKSERARLLAAGKFDAVQLAEVPDLELRAKIKARKPDAGTLADPNALWRAEKKRQLEAWVIRTQVPGPLGWNESDDGSGGGGLALALLGLLGVGYMVTR